MELSLDCPIINNTTDLESYLYRHNKKNKDDALSNINYLNIDIQTRITPESTQLFRERLYQDCAICLSKWDEASDKGPRVMVCGNFHIFHKQCIEEWVSKSDYGCPIDRATTIFLKASRVLDNEASDEAGQIRNSKIFYFFTALLLFNIFARIYSVVDSDISIYAPLGVSAEEIPNLPPGSKKPTITCTNDGMCSINESSDSVNPSGGTILKMRNWMKEHFQPYGEPIELAGNPYWIYDMGAGGYALFPA